MPKYEPILWSGDDSNAPGHYSRRKLAKIANSDWVKLGQLYREKGINHAMEFYANKHDDGWCIYCGKTFSQDAAGMKFICNAKCRYDLNKLLMETGELDPSGELKCKICGNGYPIYKEMPYTMKKKTCSSPKCMKQHKLNAKRCHDYAGRLWTMHELAEHREVTDPTMERRVSRMGVGRAMSPEKTPASEDSEVAAKNKGGIYPFSWQLRLEKCFQYSNPCAHYGICWNALSNKKRECLGPSFGIVKRDDYHVSTLNGISVSRGCRGIGTI